MPELPQSLDEAKTIVREERLKLRHAFSAIIGSRWLLAILATFVIAFGTHIAFAPTRLPPVAGLAAATSFMPAVDFGLVGEQAQQAAQSAIDQGADEEARALIAENAARIPAANVIMFALCLVLLLVNMAVMTSRRWYTKG
jgi:uncharacterized membrane protein YhaH (DUF805 family)